MKTQTNKYAPEFKNRFMTVLQGKDYADINSLYFSGGVDSTTILFALLELGRKPDLVSFELDGIPSPDRKIGSDIAKYYGLNYECVTIKVGKEDIISDVKTVIPYLKYNLKTHIQCSIPFLYMSKILSAKGHTQALTGIGAGDIFSLNKKTNIAIKEKGEEYVKRLRYVSLYEKQTSSDFDIWRVSELHGGVIMKDPYREHYLTEWMLDVPYLELHSVRKKSIVVDAFQDYWKLDEKKWYRPGNQLQIVSGIRELHDNVILNDALLNPNNNKGIIAVYNQIKRDMNTTTLDI